MAFVILDDSLRLDLPIDKIASIPPDSNGGISQQQVMNVLLSFSTS